jgi:hypothetical protein
MKAALMALVLLSLSAGVTDAQLPEAGTLDILGVNSGPLLGSDADLLQASGAKVLRIGMDWGYIEQTQGVYTYPASYDTMVSDYAARGIQVEFLLTGSVRNYLKS